MSREAVEDALTDVSFDRVALVGNDANLQRAVDQAGGNSLIIADGGAQVFDRVRLAR